MGDIPAPNFNTTQFMEPIDSDDTIAVTYHGSRKFFGTFLRRSAQSERFANLLNDPGSIGGQIARTGYFLAHPGDIPFPIRGSLWTTVVVGSYSLVGSEGILKAAQAFKRGFNAFINEPDNFKSVVDVEYAAL